ncbi:metal-dependent phosphohydrolase [Phytoactinopolyspora alkaliphila]|uniref:Metal-dependent phosphohydrolase n=1 Tax=Phytoactinopolyspora alkaliphila TaxID=1783498 RepID=A0A6N9YL22_9ACTN|nr:metal-dependent phosphohydrolase [Phytoactinopolyspora alkaliphila]NED95620.1 metal-dependent phosphohydrolase [Phytoactinopolyspora alkaliphila]
MQPAVAEKARLAARWASLTGRGDDAIRCGRDLLDRWSQPHRRYHDITHLRDVLNAVDTLAAEAADSDAVRLAVWFHDAVYDGRPGDDERASAELAAQCLRDLGLAAARVGEVIRLVLTTINHEPASDDANGAVMCDADLSVLGRDPDGYRTYTEAVREEYRHVPDDAFRTGRTAVLESLVARDPIFRTVTGRALWESAARHNLTAELAELRSG